jgi:hypothetical protein
MMQPKLDGWTIVITGNWNVNIFQPKWMEEQLGLSDVVAEVFLGPDRYEVRILSNNLLVVPRPDRLIIGTTSQIDENLASMEAIARKVLAVLEHTPINGIGINFSFEDSSPTSDLVKQFDQHNNNLLIRKIAAPIIVTEIKRSFEMENCILNYILNFSQEKINLLLNFHSEVTSAQDALARLDNNGVLFLKNMTTELLKSVYNNLEE